MFFENTEASFKILGIFYVERKKREIWEKDRLHTALSYRIQGNSLFSFDDKTKKADNGSITYLPEGCEYFRKTENDEKMIVLHLSGIGSPDKNIQILSDAWETEHLFKKMLEIWEENGSERHNRCMSLLYQIFDALQQRGSKNQPNIPASISKGIQQIHKDFRNPHLSAAEIASLCHVSESYFRRVYQEYAGESPWQTILSLRFRYACALLRSGYYSHKQVSDLSGFSDVKYFRTAFKKRYNITPSEYALKKGSSPFPE
ncbi:MAG: helix-turn-helix transcriptional regulator [Clostridia bacterium]|nr:helix-turn-helix transcriptional regulator [Clostridia bacterium]